MYKMEGKVTRGRAQGRGGTQCPRTDLEVSFWKYYVLNTSEEEHQRCLETPEWSSMKS